MASALASTLALAQDVGRVISSTPVVQQVAVPQRAYSDTEVEVQAPKSGAGAVLGAIAGGAAGNALGGRGAGQAAATMLGVIGGAIPVYYSRPYYPAINLGVGVPYWRVYRHGRHWR